MSIVNWLTAWRLSFARGLDTEDSPADEKSLRRSGGCWCGLSTLDGVADGGLRCSCSAFEAVLERRGKRLGSGLFYSHSRRYVSLDGKGVASGGCWSPGSSPGMIARENRPAPALAGRVGATEGAAGSSLERGGAGSIKRASITFSVVFD